MKTKVLIIVLAVLVVACGKHDKQKELAALRKQHDELSEKIKNLEEEIAKGDSTADSIKGIRVAVDKLKATTFVHCIEVQGKVDGDESVNVFAEGTGGMIEQIYAKEGQFVAKGQILATLDDRIYQASLKTLETNLDLATTMYNKQKALWDQKIGSEVQYLSAKTQKETLENQVASLKEQISMCKIKSPISGTVEELDVKVGQLVGPGMIAFRVINLNNLKIAADLAEGYSSRVKEGDKVTVNLPDLKKDLMGTLSFSSRYINPINRTFSVNVRIPSSDKAIKANMIAVLKITDYKADNTYAVPVNVVQNDLKGTYVLIVDNSGKKPKASKAYVSVGETYRGLTEIKSGLKTDDLIITSGYQELEDGQSVAF